MESEAKKIISFIFKRSGKNQIKKTDFYLSLSVDLKWFSPENAKEFMIFSLKNKLIIEKKNMLEPNFEINDMLIPFKYKPKNTSFSTKNFINNKEQKIIDIKDIIFNKNNYDKNRKTEITNKIEEIGVKKNIYSNTASLLIFKGLNIDVSEEIKYAENQIFED